jgi:hypothetical protein
MSQYRVFFIDDDGHIRCVPEIIECTDDKEAIGKAVPLLGGRYLEMWKLKRLVFRLAPALSTPASSRMH